MEHKTVGILLGFTRMEVVNAYADEALDCTCSVQHECGQRVYFNGSPSDHMGLYICPHCGDPGVFPRTCSNSMSFGG